MKQGLYSRLWKSRPTANDNRRQVDKVNWLQLCLGLLLFCSTGWLRKKRPNIQKQILFNHMKFWYDKFHVFCGEVFNNPWNFYASVGGTNVLRELCRVSCCTVLLKNNTDSPGTLAPSRLILLRTNQFTNRGLLFMCSSVRTIPGRPLPAFLKIADPVRSAVCM